MTSKTVDNISIMPCQITMVIAEASVDIIQALSLTHSAAVIIYWLVPQHESNTPARVEIKAPPEAFAWRQSTAQTLWAHIPVPRGWNNSELLHQQPWAVGPTPTKSPDCFPLNRLFSGFVWPRPCFFLGWSVCERALVWLLTRLG